VVFEALVEAFFILIFITCLAVVALPVVIVLLFCIGVIVSLTFSFIVSVGFELGKLLRKAIKGY